MNCHDARQHFSALLTGDVGLTESAQVNAHVGECAECGDLIEELYQLRPRQHGEGRRSSAIFRAADADSEVLDLDAGTGRERRRWFLLTSAAFIAVAAVVLVGGFVLYPDRLMRLVKPLVVASVPKASSTQQPPEPQLVPAPAESPSAPTAPRAPDTVTQSASNLPTNASSPPSNMGGEQNALPPRKIRAAASTENPPRASVPPAETPASDVIVQLSVHDRSEAERNISKLLGQVGGARLGRDRGSALTVSIPRSSYSEFTRDLAQIGSWQMEPLRAPLPDPVRVMVKLAK